MLKTNINKYLTRAASKEELSKLSGVIYLILNKIDKKIYVGQTVNTFKRRYGSKKWWESSNVNLYLKRAAKKYGAKNFEIFILENNQTLQELNKLEIFYADKFNCYVPNGYNLTGCGKNRAIHKETAKKISKGHEKHCKTRILNNPDGINVKIKNINKFCNENNLDRRTINRVLKGELHSYRGWTRKNIKIKNKRIKTGIIYNKNGEKCYINNISKFCRENKLKQNGICCLLLGTQKKSQGFTRDLKI